MSLPRGIRNNNPGNIRQNNIQWQGVSENPFDPHFVEFKEPIWGVRALMKTLLTYYRRYGLDTVQSIVNRWAPPHENATDHYVFHVARRLNVRRFDALDVEDPSILMGLARAIIVHENGFPSKKFVENDIKNWPKDWYEDALYLQAVRMAIGKQTKQQFGFETKAQRRQFLTA